MDNFFKWLLDYKRPFWVILLACISTLAIVFVLVVLTVVSLGKGWWPMPILMWIIIPIVLLIRQYRKDTS